MDYYVIGQRIRKYRKANRLSQEELAEKVGISITHMSHIETGNTKLSLPVLVKLSEELSVRTDDLLAFQMALPAKSKNPLLPLGFSSLTAGNLLCLNMNLQNRVNRQPVTILDLFKRSVVG